MAHYEAIGAMHRLELLRKIQSRVVLSASGLHPGQPPLLHYVLSHPGCTQKEAADELDVTPASAAASLKRLEKAGLVERTPDDKDARRNCIYVTQAGREKMEETKCMMDSLDAKMFSGLTETQIDDFRHTCERMFDNLADDGYRHLTVFKLAKKLHDSFQEEE